MDNVQLEFSLANALSGYSAEQIESLLEAGTKLTENLRLLDKSGENLVGRCLAHQGTFYEEEHYPQGDVFDGETHSQYYYHAHRPESGEHGHFHTFLRSAGMPGNTKPVRYRGKAKRPTGKAALSHIVAISMNRPGLPIGMFTTNRWVTDESFYSSQDVIGMMSRFSIEQSYPCLATNRSITAIVKLFRPQIEALLNKRDEVVDGWRAKHPDRDVYEDRELEITSIVEINIERQIAGLRKALRAINR